MAEFSNKLNQKINIAGKAKQLYTVTPAIAIGRREDGMLTRTMVTIVGLMIANVLVIAYFILRRRKDRKKQNKTMSLSEFVMAEAMNV